MSTIGNGARSRGIGRLAGVLAQNDVYVILVALAALAAVVNPQFLTPGNLGNLLTQSAALGIISVGQFAVVVAGGFDLSVAAVMALASIVLAKTVGTVGFGPAALLALLVGAGCGLLNGLVVTRGRVQPLIATLAMMGIARGLAFSISEKSILVNDPVLAQLRAVDGLVTVPMLAWLAVVVAAALWFRNARAALHVYAVGGNEQTARLSGVAADRTKIGVFTASGLLSGLAGIVLVVRSSSGVPLGGIGWELDSIAAIVIGGTNLFGGEGRVLHAMAGVVVYQMIANMMNLASVDPFYQDILRAAVIILAVGLSIMRQRGANRRTIIARP